ncbi:MBL fold metallo-hydrolase [Kitasatospora albolonga]|uniref:MBL fold metallo-hydrolase n=1 Tax=Kitasatospora albolonga TaxID=68173 RepID=A0ABC8BVG2_9ACTN|nr:MBL fold metallo-hydrolase [Kitasatospora albolonga]
MARRRAVLKGALAVSGVAVGAGAGAAAPGWAAARPKAYTTRVELRWLGVSGFEIVIDGRRSLLFDPYISRVPCTDPAGALDPGMPLRPDRDVVERVAERHLAGAPELIMVSHGHFDHVTDVPQLLARPGWASARIRTVCDETVRHLLTAMETPGDRVEDVIQVKGGEFLQFDGYTVEVFRSLHSQTADHGYFAPGHHCATPSRPFTIGELVEGETLAYQVSVDGGPSILLMGATNFVERELTGIRPDVALIPMTSHAAVHRYLGRLLDALGNPPLLIPCHHDDMATALTETPSLLAASVSASAAEELSRAAAPGSRVVGPQHLRTLTLS